MVTQAHSGPNQLPVPPVVRRVALPSRSATFAWHIGEVISFALPVASAGHGIAPLGIVMVVGLAGAGFSSSVVNALWLGPLVIVPSSLLRAAPARAVGALVGTIAMWSIWLWLTPGIDRGGRWLWYVTSVPFAVMTAVALVQSLRHVLAERRYRRAVAGNCDRCGYDLRASGDRCPECGAARAVPDPPEPPPKLRWPGLKNLWARRPWANIS
jgi:hypothetical protein